MIVTLHAAERAATHDGREFTGPGAVYAAARHLIDAGHQPEEPMAVQWADGRASTSATIGAYAQRAWGGAERDPQSIPYRPHPMAEISPVMTAWLEGVRREAEARRERRDAAKPKSAPTATAGEGV